MAELQLAIRPEEYFREKLTTARQRLKVSFDDHVEFYLVNLLCDFISTDSAEVIGTPLAFVLKEAVEAPPSSRIRILKRLGDTSLYMAGFFQDYFNRKTFDIGYYATLGASAYGHASTLIRDSRDEHIAGIYDELSRNFMQMVDVVAEVSTTREAASRPIDMLAIYDRWARCNSTRLRRILEENGITPIDTHIRIVQ